jgi:hypothetical protein
VKAIFSNRFKLELNQAEARYAQISPQLAGSFRERVAGQVREVIRWGGGDHMGPHGFPCRRLKPFPFYIYYQIRGEIIYFLALVHERRHPQFLKGSESS